MPRSTSLVVLPDSQQKQPEKWLARCRIICAAGSGESEASIAARLSINRKTVGLWKRRFAQEGLPGLRPQSTTQTAVLRVVVQTSGHAHSLPSPHELSFPVPLAHGRTSPLPRGAPVAALAVPRFRYLQKQFAQSPGDNRIL